MSTTTSLTEERALELLGQGIPPEMVASAIGVTVSRISQLVSDPEFSARVAELRFQNLSAHTTRDKKYDTLEDELISKLSDLTPFMVRPMEILKAIQIINAAKRRGASAPEHVVSQSTVINLVMPTQIIKKFTVNTQNQVIKAGDQELITVQSGNMQKLLQSHASKQVIEVQNEHPVQSIERSTS